MVKRHQGYCFTWNNYTEDDCSLLNRAKWIQFLAYGRELAPTTFTAHLQGFMWTTTPHTPQQVKKKLPGCVVLVPGKNKGVSHHVEDDGETGYGYCFKEHQPGWILQGIPPTEQEYLDQCPVGQGVRNDLLQVKRKIDEGVQSDELLESDDHFVAYASPPLLIP